MTFQIQYGTPSASWFSKTALWKICSPWAWLIVDSGYLWSFFFQYQPATTTTNSSTTPPRMVSARINWVRSAVLKVTPPCSTTGPHREGPGRRSRARRGGRAAAVARDLLALELVAEVQELFQRAIPERRSEREHHARGDQPEAPQRDGDSELSAADGRRRGGTRAAIGAEAADDVTALPADTEVRLIERGRSL